MIGQQLFQLGLVGRFVDRRLAQLGIHIRFLRAALGDLIVQALDLLLQRLAQRGQALTVLGLLALLVLADGDLDDYKDWLFKTKLGKGTDVLPAAGKANKTDFPVVSPVAAPAAAAAPAASKDQKRQQAEDRQRLAALRKPLEQKIKRLDDQIAKRSAQKAEVDAKLGESSIYEAANKAKLKQLLADQSFFTKDLGQLEAEWLELQEQLEALA